MLTDPGGGYCRRPYRVLAARRKDPRGPWLAGGPDSSSPSAEKIPLFFMVCRRKEEARWTWLWTNGKSGSPERTGSGSLGGWIGSPQGREARQWLAGARQMPVDARSWLSPDL
ncbi:unnamed protein product [Cuscuta campestris]|uniref:Uncharacterized protein n=1 Tax=Cuscuta campestris TaxID=132261 RepID=A0A484LC69_9ASTE|nr:unnamed protein product [Cuscuta campestris]